MTGGLGPTKDDLTKHTLAAYFNDHLVRYQDIEAHIKKMFDKIGYQFTEMDVQQAMLPEKATILKNELGTASGMWFEKEEKIVVSLPGVPHEMKGLMNAQVIPKLRAYGHLPFIIHKTVHTYGLGESRLAQRLEHWETHLPSTVKLAYLPSYGKVRLRLSVKGYELTELEHDLNKALTGLKELTKDIYIGMGKEVSIEKALHELLIKTKQTLSMAESCTGGELSKRMTSIPGASKIIKGGLVAYDPEVKINVLGVSRRLIKKYSVVSEQVAIEMARNCQALFGTDYAISTTGNAGPTTDITDHTLGTVFIAIATPQKIVAHKFNFGQPRDKVIKRASVKGIELIRKEVLKNHKNSLPD